MVIVPWQQPPFPSCLTTFPTSYVPTALCLFPVLGLLAPEVGTLSPEEAQRSQAGLESGPPAKLRSQVTGRPERHWIS